MPTFSYREMSRERKRLARNLGQQPVVSDHWRPKTYGDCAGMPRPCPFVGCKYNLYLDSGENGSVKLRKGEVEDTATNCALDVANEGGKTLEEVGELLGITRERVRQIEVQALLRIKERAIDVLDEAMNCIPDDVPETPAAPRTFASTFRKEESAAELRSVMPPIQLVA